MPSVKQKRIKRQKQYAQNKDAAKCYMKEYREKKKDSIQLSKKEYVSGSRKRDLMAQKFFLELLIPSYSMIFEL